MRIPTNPLAALALGLALATTGPVLAAEPMAATDAMPEMAAPAGDTGPASLAFAKANDTMHRDMAIAFTGNADADFARSMIPHHQGAIAMARVVLQYGSDPEIRRLAEAVIAAQESEIAVLEAWLRKNGQ